MGKEKEYHITVPKDAHSKYKRLAGKRSTTMKALATELIAREWGEEMGGKTVEEKEKEKEKEPETPPEPPEGKEPEPEPGNTFQVNL